MKDQKFGFGGKKKNLKSNTAESFAEGNFSTNKNRRLDKDLKVSKKTANGSSHSTISRKKFRRQKVRNLDQRSQTDQAKEEDKLEKLEELSSFQ